MRREQLKGIGVVSVGEPEADPDGRSAAIAFCVPPVR
jgi:hypothetical protein